MGSEYPPCKYCGEPMRRGMHFCEKMPTGYALLQPVFPVEHDIPTSQVTSGQEGGDWAEEKAREIVRVSGDWVRDIAAALREAEERGRDEATAGGVEAMKLVATQARRNAFREVEECIRDSLGIADGSKPTTRWEERSRVIQELRAKAEE